MKSLILAFLSALAISPVSFAHDISQSTEDHHNLAPEYKILQEQGHIAEIAIQINFNEADSKTHEYCYDQTKPCYGIPSGRYGFNCGKKFYDPEMIIKAGDQGCLKILENTKTRSFPAVFTAYSYGLPGPYYEWPIARNGRFWNKYRKGKNRLVITSDCKIVGAVRYKSKGLYQKCEYVPL